jgi:hypothetical protein
VGTLMPGGDYIITKYNPSIIAWQPVKMAYPAAIFEL